ncbi:MAG: hypothetical protein QGH60_07810 [Phycisphaerae bacterium]|jgi:hypothetical protein|nr:hypothetical protein [Phycisphaerae bacterium]
MDTYVQVSLIDEETGDCLGVERKKVEAFAPFVGMWISDPVWRELAGEPGGEARKVRGVCLYTQREGGPMVVYVEDVKIEKRLLGEYLRVYHKKAEWGNEWVSTGLGYHKMGF